jgi:hypothetical protein
MLTKRITSARPNTPSTPLLSKSVNGAWESNGGHDAARREVVDDHVQEFVLIGGQFSIEQKFGERLLGGFTV